MFPIISILLFCCSTQVTATNNAKVSTIESFILQFYLGEGKVITFKHTFLHYIEIKPLKNLLDSNIEYYKKNNKTAHAPSKTTEIFAYKNAMRNQLIHANFIITEAQTKIQNLTPHKITKRGLVNAVGTLSKYLFGTNGQ